MCQANPSIGRGPNTTAIGTPMNHCVSHPNQIISTRRFGAVVKGEKSCYTTHAASPTRLANFSLPLGNGLSIKILWPRASTVSPCSISVSDPPREHLS